MSVSGDLVGRLGVLGGLAALAIYFAWTQIRTRSVKDALNNYDYVVFEAEVSDVDLLRSDLAHNGWNLIQTSRVDEKRSLYRFEKTVGNATKLGEICLNFEKCMPLTADRKSKTIIKIKDHGLKSQAHAQTH